MPGSLARSRFAPPTPDRRAPATRAINRHAGEAGRGIGWYAKRVALRREDSRDFVEFRSTRIRWVGRDKCHESVDEFGQ